MSLSSRGGAAPRFPGYLHAATVTRVDATGVYVTLDHRGAAEVGPCRFEPRRLPVAIAGGHVHVADAGDPPETTRCLVTFADDRPAGSRARAPGFTQPWIVAFEGWPA